MGLFDALIAEAPAATNSYRYGTVTSTSPLRIRLDGDESPADIPPVALCQVGTGDRVLAQIYGRQLWVVGRVGGYGAMVALGNTEHLDSLPESGLYHQQLNVNADTARGYPVSQAGLLEVMNASHITDSGISYVYQRYTLFNGARVFERTNYNGSPSGSWNPWREIFTHSVGATLDTLVQALITAPSGTRTSLDSRYATAGSGGGGGPWVNVLDHGALGNGTTNDAAAFTAALNAIDAAGGGVLYLPPGKTYLINSQVRLRSNLWVYGYGATVKKTSSGNVMFSITSRGSTGYGSGAKNVRVSGLRFLGDFASAVARNCTSINHGENLVFEDLVYEQALTSGHCLDLMGCKNVTIRNCRFRGQYQVSGRLYAEAVQIDHSGHSNAGSELDENDASWDGLPTINVRMDNCHSEALSVSGTTHPAPRLIGGHSRVEARKHKNIMITNCSIIGGSATGDDGQYQGWIHFIHADGVQIHGCYFENTTGVAATAVGFQGVTNTYPMSTIASLDAEVTSAAGPVACSDITISECTFKGFDSSTVRDVIRGWGVSTQQLRRITVTDCQFSGLHPGGATLYDAGATAVELKDVIEGTVQNSQVYDCRRLVNAEDCIHITVQGNQARYVYGTLVRATGVVGLIMSLNTASLYNGMLYTSSCSTVAVTGNTSHQTMSGAATPYGAVYSFNAAAGVAIANNTAHASSGVFSYFFNFYSISIESSAVGNVSRGAGSMQVQSGSTVATSTNTVY